MTRVVPHEHQAERTLLGMWLLPSRDVQQKTVNMLMPLDFYLPSHRKIFSVMQEMWRRGHPVDWHSVVATLEREAVLDNICGPSLQGVALNGRSYLSDLQANASLAASAEYYAGLIIEASRARELIHLAEVAITEAYVRRETAEVLGDLKTGIAGIDATIVGGDSPYEWDMDEFLSRDPDKLAPWLIPGALRVHDRGIIVGPEGHGKTMFVHQFGVAAACGIHPFTLEEIEPIRCLVIDAENNKRRLQSGLQLLKSRLSALPGYRPGQVRGYNRPEGINLADRVAVADLERTIAKFRPDIVVGGPLYKMCRRGTGMNDEEIAMTVQEILDEWRIRFDFGFLMEHHASKGPSGGLRVWIPRGSALWIYWPEYGFTYSPADESNLLYSLGRYRLDRDEVNWPGQVRKAISQYDKCLPFEALDTSGPVPVKMTSVPLTTPSFAADDDEPF